MTRLNPAPKECDTPEEQRAYWRDVERQRDLEDLDRPSRWDY